MPRPHFRIVVILLLLLQQASACHIIAHGKVRPRKVRSKCFELLSTKQTSPFRPIDPTGWPKKFPAKEHCSRCGLCETSFVHRVKDACAFLDTGMAHLDQLEPHVHGQAPSGTLVWDASNAAEGDDARFGMLHTPIQLVKAVNMPDAQWTGVVTSIAVAMLEAGTVDAVVCIAAGGGDSEHRRWNEPHPVVARTVEQVLQGRGVKPALAPSLNVLDEIRKDQSIRNLLFCGVGCSVQAFRVVQDELGIDNVYVLGTNCVDNSPTPEAANAFVRKGLGIAENVKVRGYEFMQDFRVHIKTPAEYVTLPYFSLPGTIAVPSIAKSCLACFDYTNRVADVVVGYMGAPLEPGAKMTDSYQTLTVRNARGATMIETACSSGRLQVGPIANGRGSFEQLVSATTLSDAIVQSMMGRPAAENGLPVWLGELFACVFRAVGPKGLNFARYSIDYHTLRNYFHLLKTYGEERAAKSMPSFAAAIVQHYLDTDRGIRQIRDRILKNR